MKKISISDFLISSTDLDECSSNPCQNGGTCADGVNKYTCNCVAGYVGTRCQTSKYIIQGKQQGSSQKM